MEESSLTQRMTIRADEVRRGDYCVSKVGRREWLYLVTRTPVEQPMGVVSIHFEREHYWNLPSQREVEVFRLAKHVVLKCSFCKEHLGKCACMYPIWETVVIEVAVVYVVIGNSDNKLRQDEWADFWENINTAIEARAEQVFGVWSSNSVSKYQNACWSFEIERGAPAVNLVNMLNDIRKHFRQDSIIWSEAMPRMIGVDSEVNPT